MGVESRIQFKFINLKMYIFSVLGPVKYCVSIGLASAVPPNPSVYLQRRHTYREAHNICSMNGMVLANQDDPWVSMCSNSFIAMLRQRLGITFWDQNDKAKSLTQPKKGIVCIYLNWRAPSPRSGSPISHILNSGK